MAEEQQLQDPLQDFSSVPLKPGHDREIQDWCVQEGLNHNHPAKPNDYDKAALQDYEHNPEADWILHGKHIDRLPQIQNAKEEKFVDSQDRSKHSNARTKVVLIKRVVSEKRKKTLDTLWRIIKGLSHSRMYNIFTHSGSKKTP